MRLTIHAAVRERFPGTVLGVAVVSGIAHSGEDPAVTAGLRRAEAALPALLNGMPVADHPRIAVWRDAYRRFRARPKDHPSSVENLVRRVDKGWAVPHIHRLVDIYNAV